MGRGNDLLAVVVAVQEAVASSPSTITGNQESSGGSPEVDGAAGDPVLSYINKWLMMEDDDNAVSPGASDDAAVLAAEKPFLDILNGGGCCSGECSAESGASNGVGIDEARAGRCDLEMVREMFDKVLLCPGESCELRAPLPRDADACGKRERRRRRCGEDDEPIDLTAILIRCAQAVAVDDRRSVGELLRQIRQHSCPDGDSGQRLAHCFANALEARVAGAGSDAYRSLAAKRATTADILKAYHLYQTACPFKRISHFFSNNAILTAAEGADRIHIVDYGIYYGFQWPCFMQRLASRPGGPPRLRITGIDLPAQRIEETGCWLAEYASHFGIPFEYRAIAAQWEGIRVAELRVEAGELLVVNCLHRLRNTMDESGTAESPRARVLATIKKLNPRLFVHGVLSSSFGAPFFVTRFKEALFHYSSLFDMLEATTGRADEQRLLIERDLFGREVLNAVACEGAQRVERPETYRQWQARNLRAGLRQRPLQRETVSKAKLKVSKCYHRDFNVGEDHRWLLLGWKGRTIYALSTWSAS